MKFTIESETRKDGSKILFDIFNAYETRQRTLSPSHIHSYYEVVLCKNGSEQFFFGESDNVVLTAGDIIIIYPNVVHTTTTPPGTELNHTFQLVVKFSPMFFTPASPTMSDIQYLLIPQSYPDDYHVVRAGDDGNAYLRGLIETACEEKYGKELGYEIILRANSSLIYSWIVRNLSVRDERPHNFPMDEQSIRLIYKATAFIEDNYHNDISMEDVARACNISYYYFSRLFRQYTNGTFSKYLTNIRVNKARKLLLQTDQPVTNIAMDCGFENLSYFIKKFHEITGLTPKSFRKQYRGVSRDSTADAP